jgi:hypothetical protein
VHSSRKCQHLWYSNCKWGDHFLIILLFRRKYGYYFVWDLQQW